MMKLNVTIFSVLMMFMLFFVVACGSESKETTVVQPMPVPALDEGAPQEAIVTPESAESAPVETTPTETASAEAPASPSSGEVKELVITGSNFKWDVVGPTIKKGDTVKLTVKVAEGGHGFALPEFNIRSNELGQGKEQIIEFVADKSGSFEYFCNVPCGSGHRQMRGMLIVEE